MARNNTNAWGAVAAMNPKNNSLLPMPLVLQIPKFPGPAGILIIHSWWGQTSSFIDFGAALAREGFVVGVSDLFDGKVAETEAEARSLRQAPRRVPMYRCLGADLDDLRDATRGDTPRIGVVGFSMGGHWAVWLSQRPEYRIASAVLYYAARAGDFSRANCEFLAHFAETDPWVSPKARQRMESAIRGADCPYRSFDYPGTDHWFAESARRKEFRPAPAALAFDRTVEHFRRSLVDEPELKLV